MLGTPTYAPDLAQALVSLTLAAVSGIRHVIGDELVSRYELARRVAIACGADPELVIDEHVTDNVNRPLRSWMVSVHPTTMTPLDEALRLVTT
jgi:dTDP-4-dehydrorhamnose reductase